MQLECRDLWKQYDDRVIVRDLNWRVCAGELWCVHGSSGVGKTTLLRLLLGLETPDKGTVVRKDGLRFAPVFQEDRLLTGHSAIVNCAVFTGAAQERILSVLRELLDESKALTKPIEQLSGGMRRRVALARALLAESDILCLDEPFAGLDPLTRERAWRVVERYRNGRTVLLVSHEFTPQQANCLELNG